MFNYEKIHFGVDYYPEHWPEERWETDAKLMRDMGVQVVRMAEFSWHKMEPVEGSFDFEWLDRIIALMGSYGIKTVLGTPTAAPPAWLVNRYPEILPVDRNGIVHGFGGRHHDCQSNELYREKCSIIVTKMAEHFKDNPGVIGWQPDNELGNSHDDFCTCNSCRSAFQKWLAGKYGNVERLNRAWGTAFWSQEYNDFSEVFTPRVTATGENPSQMLDWRCFHSDLILDFFKNQANIIRKICPNHFITHNYMGFSDTVDYYDLGELLDFVSHDQYPSGYWFKDGMCPPAELAATLDIIRSYKDKTFWIMEQQAGITGWGEMGRLPKPGQISMWALQSVAHGADAIVFFRWRSCALGTEQYWHGILPHSGIPGRTYNELTETVKKVLPVMDEISGAMPANDIGIVYSFRQEYAFRTQKHNPKLEYIKNVNNYYRALYNRNIGCDYLENSGTFSKYRVIIAPLQYLMNPELENKYTEYVNSGGTLILTMRTGVKDEDNIVMTDMPLPGRLSEVTGCSVYEYDSLNERRVKVSMGKEDDLYATVWADLVTPDSDTETLAYYADSFYKGVSCVTRHKYGRGTCYYVGTEPDDELMKLIMDDVLKTARIEEKYEADAGIEITERVKGENTYIFAINHSDSEGEYRGVEGTLLYGNGSNIGFLKPQEVHIVKK